MQRKRKCQGFLCGTLLPGGLSYLLYLKSHPLLHFDGIWGNLFRLKGHIPHSILTVVDSNKIMLTFSNFRFSLLSGTNIHFILYVCLFPALEERETSCNAGIQIHCQGLKDEWGLILNKSCLNRAKF